MKRTITLWLLCIIAIASCHKQIELPQPKAEDKNVTVDFNNLSGLQVRVCFRLNVKYGDTTSNWVNQLDSRNGLIQKIKLDPLKQYDYGIQILNPQLPRWPSCSVNFHSTDTIYWSGIGFRPKMILSINDSYADDEWRLGAWPSLYYKFDKSCEVPQP